MNKIIIFSLCSLFLISFGISESFAACIYDEQTGKYLEPCRGLPTFNADSEKIFVIDGYEIISNSSAVSEILLDWNNPQLPEGEIILKHPINGTIELQIPKEMHRTMNLNFGSNLIPLGEQRTNIISESESLCNYLISFKFENKDRMKFGSASLAAGNWEPVSIMNQECGDYTLKQQIENNMTAQEIECSSNKHVLVERSNEKLACVYPETAEKLGWKIVS